MNQYIQGRLARQVRRVSPCRRQMVEDQDLCFSQLLSRAQVEAAVEQQEVHFRERLYTPLLTIWTFLYQVLASDQSCRAAVARLLAFLCVGGDHSVRAKTDPYCKARQRLPEALLADLARRTGWEVQRQVPSATLLGGRPIKIADGTTASMPDTPANQRAYPPQAAQKKGLGFPLLRLVGLIGLSSGAVLDVAMGAYQGKRTGETALLRQLWDHLEAGDILLADAIFSNYWTVALLLERGVDLLSRHGGTRRIDFRRGRRLSHHDHVVPWTKPVRPYWMSPELYQSLPQTLSLREVQIPVAVKGFRCRCLRLVTTLRDPKTYRKEDLATAFRCRWQAELDLRSIKQVMQMDVLRCKSPAMVRKEIWMHLLAYNLIRKLMAQAATAAGVHPWDISFTGTLRTLLAFAAAGWSCPERKDQLYAAVIAAVAIHRVHDRPDRVEPRAVKRRPKKQVYLNDPRPIAKTRLLNTT